MMCIVDLLMMMYTFVASTKHGSVACVRRYGATVYKNVRRNLTAIPGVRFSRRKGPQNTPTSGPVVFAVGPTMLPPDPIISSRAFARVRLDVLGMVMSVRCLTSRWYQQLCRNDEKRCVHLMERKRNCVGGLAVGTVGFWSGSLTTFVTVLHRLPAGFHRHRTTKTLICFK